MLMAESFDEAMANMEQERAQNVNSPPDDPLCRWDSIKWVKIQWPSMGHRPEDKVGEFDPTWPVGTRDGVTLACDCPKVFFAADELKGVCVKCWVGHVYYRQKDIGKRTFFISKSWCQTCYSIWIVHLHEVRADAATPQSGLLGAHAQLHQVIQMQQDSIKATQLAQVGHVRCERSYIMPIILAFHMDILASSHKLRYFYYAPTLKGRKDTKFEVQVL
ncbi:hypothetical protein BC829DRAFT_422154 [Chytridium lagenaria]|nr:hypothetical protein BC829DRAFT_422154 [Chytridium lagenaria]